MKLVAIAKCKMSPFDSYREIYKNDEGYYQESNTRLQSRKSRRYKIDTLEKCLEKNYLELVEETA